MLGEPGGSAFDQAQRLLAAAGTDMHGRDQAAADDQLFLQGGGQHLRRSGADDGVKGRGSQQSLGPTLPNGITPAPGGSCAQDPETPGLLTCQLGDVAAGETVVVDVRVLIGATLSGSVVNGAIVPAAAVDREPDDNTSTVTSLVALPLPATGSSPLLPALALLLLALGSVLVWWSPRRADR